MQNEIYLIDQVLTSFGVQKMYLMNVIVNRLQFANALRRSENADRIRLKGIVFRCTFHQMMVL